MPTEEAKKALKIIRLLEKNKETDLLVFFLKMIDTLEDLSDEDYVPGQIEDIDIKVIKNIYTLQYKNDEIMKYTFGNEHYQKIKNIYNLCETPLDKINYLLTHKHKIDDIKPTLIFSRNNKVDEINNEGLFKGFKGMCHKIALIIIEINPNYKFPIYFY